MLPLVVHSTSPALTARRARVAGGAEEPLLARRVRSSKRRRHDAHAAPRRRRARDPRCSPFASESGCARPRERRAVGARPMRLCGAPHNRVGRFPQPSHERRLDRRETRGNRPTRQRADPRAARSQSLAKQPRRLHARWRLPLGGSECVHTAAEREASLVRRSP